MVSIDSHGGIYVIRYLSGMTTIEHSIPISVLYDDVAILWARSGTGSTPTHVVNYGGAWGEQVLWAKEDIPNDPKYVLMILT